MEWDGRPNVFIQKDIPPFSHSLPSKQETDSPFHSRRTRPTIFLCNDPASAVRGVSSPFSINLENVLTPTDLFVIISCSCHHLKKYENFTVHMFDVPLEAIDLTPCQKNGRDDCRETLATLPCTVPSRELVATDVCRRNTQETCSENIETEIV